MPFVGYVAKDWGFFMGIGVCNGEFGRTSCSGGESVSGGG